MKLKKYQAISRLFRYMFYCENSENNMTDQYDIAKKKLRNLVYNGYSCFKLQGLNGEITDKITPERLVFFLPLKGYEYIITVRPSLSTEYLLTIKGKHEGKSHIADLMDRFLSEIVDFE